MTETKIDRRSFLKALGLGGAGVALAGCDLPSYVTLEEGEETVLSYLAPDDYTIPGVGQWYASTCLQCAAGCGVHGRVREGRVLKLEGNPKSALNKGRLCQMGQAGLQTHFNPDRVQTPMVRKGGKLAPASWDEALETINAKPGHAAWMTGTISGHQRTMVEAHLAAMGDGSHYVMEVINQQAWSQAARDMLGDSQPRLRIDKAEVIFSLGADFLGTFGSPVSNAAQYADFRTVPRGVLIQAEPAMSLTGANADHWVGVSPGGEVALAMGVAHELVKGNNITTTALPANIRRLIELYDPAATAAAAGVRAETVTKIATMLAEHDPSLVLAGGSATQGENGYQVAVAAMTLNILLNNIGRTIEASNKPAYAQLAPIEGNTADLAGFIAEAEAGAIDVAFVSGANPLYVAPEALGMANAWNKIGFKVVLATFMDETAEGADVVLPMASALEDWGSHVAASDGGAAELLLQQPLMEPVFPETRGFGDVVLAMAKAKGASGLDDFDDYYALLRTAVSAMKGSANESDWLAALSEGQTPMATTKRALYPQFEDITLAAPAEKDGKLVLVAAPRQGMWDGRHANLPWLQEAPDQISKVVWDSWAELHPSTAKRLGVKEGDYVTVSSASGAISTRVYIYKGVHPDAIAIPIGRGHSAMGRWAKDNGVNPLSILDAVFEAKTGELAMAATRVDVRADGKNRHLVKLMEVDSQHGRKLAATIPAAQQHRTEGGA